MAKGWFLESRRHSLASRGIKTAQKLPSLANVSDEQLKELYKINVTEDKLTAIRKEMEKRKSFTEIPIKSFRKWEHYQTKENRDKRFKELVAKHGNIFRRTSRQGQVLHPQYVEDWEGEVQTGIGNVQYKTMFPVLYNIEFKHGHDEGDLK